jgi:hypothetical protein
MKLLDVDLFVALPLLQEYEQAAAHRPRCGSRELDMEEDVGRCHGLSAGLARGYHAAGCYRCPNKKVN